MEIEKIEMGEDFKEIVKTILEQHEKILKMNYLILHHFASPVFLHKGSPEEIAKMKKGILS